MSLLALGLAGLIDRAEAGENQMRPDGRDAFKTQVTGFLTTGNPTVSEAAMLDESHRPEAYFTVTDFYDLPFRDQLLKQIAAGNTLNQLDGKGRVQFRLGCFENYQIVSDSMEVPSQTVLMESSPRKPVTVELEFKKGTGGGWECSSFADGLRVTSTTDTTVSR